MKLLNKSENPRLIRYQEKMVSWDTLIMSIIMIATAFLPALSYVYQKKTYTLSGIELIAGKTVRGGRTVITPHIPSIIILIALILLLAGSIMSKFISKKICEGIIAITSIIVVVCNIALAMQANKLLDRASKVNISYGSIICVFLGVLITIRAIYILWRMKVLSTLDFMAVPGMMYFIINNYIPMVGITIAFKKIDFSVGIFASPWVGFENFKSLFASSTGSILQSDAFLITRNTLLYNAAFIILGIITGVIAGICLAEIGSRFMQKFFQTSILLPQLISYVIVAYIVYAFFSNQSGLVNSILGEENAINFYAQTKYWPFILIFIYIWKMIGYNAIIFLSSIVGIDRSIYEAGRVDGANRWQQIRHITLPMIKPTVMTLFLLNVGRIMYSDFGLFYQVPMDSGALYSVTNTIDTYVYRSLMTLNNISTSSAASTYQAVIGFALVLIVNLIVRRKDKENALF